MQEEDTKSCEDKIAFATKREAETAATVAKWEHGSQPQSKLIAYKCKECDLFHLASKYTDV